MSKGIMRPMKRNDNGIMRIPEEKEKGKVTENIFKAIMPDNFTNLGVEIDIQVQEA